MAEYRIDEPVAAPRRSSSGITIGIIVLCIAAIVALLFATGFWKANVSGGEMPKVQVSAKGGEMPDVDLESKKIVVGTKQTTVDVPKVETVKKKIDVPVAGVTDGK